jgi:cell wall-associated NlpC family hydrolase
MTTWTPKLTPTPITDPLTDPLAAALRNARPDDLALLQRDFLNAAEQARRTGRGLTQAAGDAQWTGAAADAFRTAVGELPTHLEAIDAGYSSVASALSSYIDRVQQYQSQFAGDTAQLEEAQVRQDGQQETYDTARAAFDKVLHGAPGPGHAAALSRAQGELNAAQRQLDYWNGQVSQLTSRAAEVLEDFLMSRETCRHLVSLAASAAPQPVVKPINVIASTDAPADVRIKLSAMNDTIGSLMGTPYVYGGGHGGQFGPSAGGLDCSGFVSTVLHSAGYLSTPQTTEGLAAQAGLATGHGRYVTLYDRVDSGDNDHVIMSINGHFFEEGGSGGTQNVHAFTPTASYLASFNRVMHPVGL